MTIKLHALAKKLLMKELFIIKNSLKVLFNMLKNHGMLLLLLLLDLLRLVDYILLSETSCSKTINFISFSLKEKLMDAELHLKTSLMEIYPEENKIRMEQTANWKMQFKMLIRNSKEVKEKKTMTLSKEFEIIHA